MNNAKLEQGPNHEITIEIGGVFDFSHGEIKQR